MVQFRNRRFAGDHIFFAKILWFRRVREVYEKIIISDGVFNLRFNLLRHNRFGAETEVEKDEV